MKEFEFIRTLLAPLSKSRGAALLQDDVAELEASETPQIITTDTLVEGIHFFKSDPLVKIGQKLVRVNVSDCFAKGALPRFALFNLVWPHSRTDADLGDLVAGLAQDFETFGIDLIGGDTTSTNGPLVLSMTIIAVSAGRRIVRRNGASSNEDIWVTGEIGHGLLGLRALESGRADEFPESVGHFLVPNLPDAGTAQVIDRFATASADISDGLLADMVHIANASGCGAELRMDAIPFASAVGLNITRPELAAGGDDFQTLFTAPAEKRSDIESFSSIRGISLSRIGTTNSGAGVKLLDGNGMPIETLKTGWEHGHTS